MRVKSDRPMRPGACCCRKITSCSGPCAARQTRIRRSRVRRTPRFRSGCRRSSSRNTPTGRMPGLFSRIGTTSASKMLASGSGPAPSPQGFLLRGKRRIPVDPDAGGTAEARLRGGNVCWVDFFLFHVKPHLLIGYMAARHLALLHRESGKATIQPTASVKQGSGAQLFFCRSAA